jgi:NADH-quinone oxidoreductase subunit A
LASGRGREGPGGWPGKTICADYVGKLFSCPRFHTRRPGLRCAPILLGWLIAPNRPDSEKLSPFECGFEAFEDARMKFDVRFYLIAIIFILFDLEIAFLFPWAVIFKDIVSSETMRLFGFFEMMVFIGILAIGYVYAWAKGALDWE